jgi:ankyrin repeat protein
MLKQAFESGMSRVLLGPLLLVVVIAALFALAILTARRWEHGDWRDPRTGQRHCRTPEEAVAGWANSYSQRGPPERRRAELARLESWAAKHPRDVNRLYWASCQTAMHAAAQYGRADVARVLLARGADVNARDEYGDAPLHLAARHGRVEVARLLVESGADVNARGQSRETPLHAAIKGLFSREGLEGRLQVARMLLAHGADVNARDGSGRTPLRYAVGSTTPIDTMVARPMTDLLLAHGAATEVADLERSTPLHEAAFHGDTALVRRLLEQGAAPNTLNRFTTPLGSAAQGGHVEVVRLLLESGADPNRRSPGSPLDWEGLPLAVALTSYAEEPSEMTARRLAVARLLVEHGANPGARNKRGETLLHGATSRGNPAEVDLLLSLGADPDAADSAGFTPLHRAVEEGQLEIARRLLVAGADAGRTASDGTSPRGLAAGDPEMEALLGGRATR